MHSPESFGFLSLYAYPHYALARALLLWGLVAFLRAAARIDEGRPLIRAGLKVGFLWVLAGLAQPLTGMVVVAVVGLYLLALAAWQLWLELRGEPTDWPKLGKVVRLAISSSLLPAPFIVYNLATTRMDPFLRMVLEQSPFPSPHPLHFLLAYALVLPFAVIGGRQLWLEKWESRLPVAWTVFFPILAYAPVGVQRRLLEGVWVALVVLAMKGLEAMAPRVARRSAAVLLLTLPSTVVLLVGGTLEALDPSEPVFRPADEVSAFRSLAGQTSRDTVVLASYGSGNALPAWAPVFVILGHGSESVRYSELMHRVAAFYHEETPTSERLELLSEFDVDYVFWGSNERALGSWDPRSAEYLSPLHQSGDYYLFAVR
jgi:hypothetical protein